MEGKFLISVGDATPAIMCENHARAFEQLMMDEGLIHTIYELDDGDGPYKCHACDLQVAQEEANRPRIILPN